MDNRVDPRALQEALATIYDKDRLSLADEQKAYRAGLVKKWAWYMGETVLGKSVQPIEPRLWEMMAVLFENQLQANRPPQSIYEATTLTTVPIPTTWALPIIRDLFPSLIMNKICSVQPMPAQSAGSMRVYWWRAYREDNSPEDRVTVPDSDYTPRDENAVPKRLRYKLTNTTVEATKDILNATWSSEAEEDVAGGLGLNLEQELLTVMTEEILRELEQRVLTAILVGATAGNVNWAWTPTAAYTSAQEYYQTLFHAFIDAENYVAAAMYRNCDYIIAGSRVLGYLKKASTWEMAPRSLDPAGPVASGVQLSGRVGMWDVYSTPYINQDRAIISYYPKGMLHGGYIFAPYIPLMPMPKVYAEMQPYDDATLPGAYVNTDKWNRNVRTRNAVYFCEPQMFATISISA